MMNSNSQEVKWRNGNEKQGIDERDDVDRMILSI